MKCLQCSPTGQLILVDGSVNFSEMLVRREGLLTALRGKLVEYNLYKPVSDAEAQWHAL